MHVKLPWFIQKIIFMVKVLELPSSKTKIAMIYKLKLPHGNFSLSPITSRKLGFGHRAIFTLVPVQSRTGTNVSIGPGSCG